MAPVGNTRADYNTRLLAAHGPHSFFYLAWPCFPLPMRNWRSAT
jgi:hypothetical protein